MVVVKYTGIALFNETKNMRQKITSKFLVLGVLSTLVLSWFVVLTPQTANAAPLSCEIGFYQMINSQLRILDPETGTYTSIGGVLPNSPNAMGYNIEDDYLYAMSNDAGSLAHLLRIEDDGSYTDLGLPTGLPADNYIAGDFDASGNLYVREYNASTDIWVIDVSTNTASVLNLSGNLFVSELVYIDGYLYAQQGTGFRRIEVATGTITSSTPTGLPGDVAGFEAFGAGWATVDDELFLARNSTGIIYRVDDYNTGSPTFTPVLQGVIPTNNDGASCPNATSPIQELTATDDSATTTANTPLTIPVGSGVLTNDMGDTITVTAYTQPSHGSVSVNTDGSFTYTPADGFTGTDTFTYTITDTFGLTATATVTIQVSDAAVTVSEPSDTESTLADTGQPAYFLGIVGIALLVTALLIRRKFRY